jgi:polysaccharide deacetylase family protein (PEP-CTERM system associated)
VFPIQHDNYGMPDAALEPYEIVAPSGRKLVEFPMSIVNWGKVKLPVSGGGYFRIFPYWITRKSLARINEHEQRPFVFYLHPWEIDPGQPRIRASLKSRLRHYTNLSRCEARLGRLLDEFAFAPMREVLSATAVGGAVRARS